MKRDYDKLHRRYVRHNHESHKDSDRSEVRKMSAKLEVENYFVNLSGNLRICFNCVVTLVQN